MIGLALALFAILDAHADPTYQIRIETQALLDAPPASGHYALALTLLNGDSLHNSTVTLSQFDLGGGTPVGSPMTTGGASGDLASSVVLTDSSFYNDLVQPFLPGSTLSFLLAFHSTNTLPTPDSFSIAILDDQGRPIPTLEPLTGQSFLIAELAADGGQTIVNLQVYGSDPSQTSLRIPAPSARLIGVPEPPSLGTGLLGIGIVVLGAARLRQANVSARRLLPLLAFATTFLGSTAEAQSLIGGVLSGGKIYDVRPLGEPFRPRETGLAALRSLAFDDQGQLFAMTDGVYEHGESQLRAALWRIDLATGAPTRIGQPYLVPGQPLNWSGRLTYDPGRRAMFLKWNNALYRIHLETAQLTLALEFHFEQRPPDAPTGSLPLASIGFDDDGQLWGAFRISPTYVRPPRYGIGRIDTTSGAIVSLIPMIYAPPAYQGQNVFPPVGQDLVLDPRTRTFLTNVSTQLYRVDPATGYTTRLVNTALPGGSEISSLAGFQPASRIGDVFHYQETFPIVSVIRGGFVLDRVTGDFVQRIRLVSDRPIPGPISILVNIYSSSTGVALKNADGVYAPHQIPRIVARSAQQGLVPGVPADVVLRFANPSKKPIEYFLNVVVGEYSLGP